MGTITDLIILCPLCGSRLRPGIFGLECPFHGQNIYCRTDSADNPDKYLINGDKNER